jgi:D-alanyl-D-alanine carboxypeptidase/D-alanyl-D-alanine-endopeptidase (penicillin-binding protein 4)
VAAVPGIVTRVRTLALAGVVATLVALPVSVDAARIGEPPATPRWTVLDDGGVTPRAEPGTPLAARASLSESQLKGQLEQQMDRVGGASGAWVYALRGPGRGGEVLYNDSGHRARILASNSKLFATAAFLNRFGPTGTLETGVWERGQRGGGRDQIVRGGLVLVGDGDPALASSRFARKHNLPATRLKPLAEHVRQAGIRRVKGNLMVDPTIFDGKRSVPQPGITGGPFLSTLSGLSYNSGFDGGHYADSPERIAGRQFVQALRRAGVTVEGRVRVGGAPAKVFAERAIDRIRSPIAAKLIKQTNTPSDNFFAEMLLKRLAARKGHQGSTARGAAKAEDFARGVGSGAHLVNGSGLSRTNTSTPSQVGKLLVHMANDNDLDRAFRKSLAIAGRTGTLSQRMRGTAAEGRCSAKTGTIDGVSALSGYCKSRSGLVAFSILMNSINTTTARNAQDAMAAAIARYRR